MNKTELKALKKDDLIEKFLELQSQDDKVELLKVQEQLKEKEEEYSELVDDLAEAEAESQELQEKLDRIVDQLNLYKLRHTLEDILNNWSPSAVLEVRRALEDVEAAYKDAQGINWRN